MQTLFAGSHWGLFQCYTSAYIADRAILYFSFKPHNLNENWKGIIHAEWLYQSIYNTEQ